MPLNFLNTGYFAGKVGIGTDSPNKTLELGYSNTEQNVLLNGLPGGDVGTGILVFNTDTTTDEPFANIDFRAGNADGRIAIQRSASNTSNFHFITDSNNTFATKMFLKHSGQLGLGTTDPIKNIEVSYSNTETDVNDNLAGAAAGTGVLLRNLAGTGFANVDFRVNDADGRIAYEWTASNTGNFHFITDNAGTIGTKMFIAAGGNVGIGTTSPVSTWLNTFEPSTGNDTFKLTSEGWIVTPYLTGLAAYYPSQGARPIFWSDVNGTNIQSWDNDAADAISLRSSNGSIRLIVKEGGNVGIGVTSPDAKLHIADTNKAINSEGNLFIATTDDYAIDKGGQISLGGVWHSTPLTTEFAAIAGRKQTAVNGNAGGYLQLSTSNSSGGNLTEKMRITSDGSVGIGTDDPIAPLHVVTPAVGGVNLTDISRTADNLVRFTNPQYSTSATMGLLLRVFPDSDARQGAGLLMTGGSDNAASNLSLFVSKDDGTSSNISQSYSALHIAGNTGNVGIGETSPDGKLHVHQTGSGTLTTIITEDDARKLFIGRDAINCKDLNNNGALLYLNQAGGNVNISNNLGIGTTIPDFKLDVEGTFGVSNLPGNVTSTSVLVRNETIGSEILSNPDFATNTIWGGSGSIANGQLTKTGGGLAYQTYSGLSSGAMYLVEVDVASIAGTANFYLGGTNSSALIVGKQSFYQLGGDANALVGFNNGYVGSTGSVFNSVSLKLVTSASDQIQTRQLSSDAFGPGNGPYLPLSAGSGFPLTGDLYTGTNAINTRRLNINSFSAGAGLVMNYGNATGTVEFISLQSNGVTSPIKLQMRQSPNESDLILAGSSGTGLTLTSASNALFEGNVGIGVTGPQSKLQVDGGIQMADDTDTASVTKVGTMRYRTATNEPVPVTGTDLVTNGDLAASTGWNLQNSASINNTTGVATVPGAGSLTSTGGNWSLYQDNVMDPNKTYMLRFQARRDAGPNANMYAGWAYTNQFNQTVTFDWVQYEVVFTTTSQTWDELTFGGVTGTTFEVKDIVVIEVTEENASYADMCMQTGSSTYEWVNIVRNTY